MLGLAIFYIVISAASIGVMSELRKMYQVKSGTGLVSTSMFLAIGMFVAFLGGILTGKISFDYSLIIIALIYAGIASVNAMLCLVGSAWGKLSTIVICATLGNLVLPAVYGLIVLPSENVLTVYKIIGFIFAFLTYIMNFLKKEKDASKSKSNFKFKLICIIVFFVQGSALIVLNIVNRLGFGSFGFVTLHTGLASLIMVLTVIGYVLIFGKKGTLEVKKSISKNGLLLMLGYGVLTLVSERCALLCAGMVPLVFQAPVSFCVSIIVVSLLEFVIYKEKISKVELLQIIFAIICNIMFVI